MHKNFWSKLNHPILALAPMAGITDSAFRQICRQHGADVVYSEMASVSALYFKPAKTLELVRFNKKERPYVVQLFGKDPAHFAKAAQIITQKVKPDGIDINFGCPAKKVFGHGSGCALMPQKKLAREIITVVCENTDLPVSLKIRAGVRDTTALAFIKNIKDLPFAAVMVHGRTYDGSFHGPVDFGIAEKIKKIIPDKIVLANGGIDAPEKAMEILQKYPTLDGLGIARGAWGRPFIFDEIKNLLSCHPGLAPGGDPGSNENHKLSQGIRFRVKPGMTIIYNFKKIKKIMLRHAQLIWQDKKETGMFEIRKHLVWYIKGFPGAADLRKKLVQAKSVKEIKKYLEINAPFCQSVRNIGISWR
jgi:nifR3 family TIM-barrel protein